MRLRALTEDDVARVVAAWNQHLVHDQLSPERFRELMLGDPNYEAEGMTVAEGEEGEVLGFSGVIVRREVAGRDGGGREWEFDRGFLKGFFAAEADRGAAAARALLGEAEAYCSAAGKEVLFVTEYAGPYVYPGIDVRYQRLRGILGEQGYRDIWTIHDVSTDLRDANVGEMLDQTRGRMPAGVEVMTWEPSLLPAMRAFAAEGDMPPWFPAGWESRLARPRETVLVLRKGEEILGWARYWPGKPRAGFGPILVLPRARGQGYGARLLLECMVRAREAGAERMEAGWANTGFYTRHGWEITRRYAVLKKELG